MCGARYALQPTLSCNKQWNINTVIHFLVTFCVTGAALVTEVKLQACLKVGFKKGTVCGREFLKKRAGGAVDMNS